VSSFTSEKWKSLECSEYSRKRALFSCAHFLWNNLLKFFFVFVCCCFSCHPKLVAWLWESNNFNSMRVKWILPLAKDTEYSTLFQWHTMKIGLKKGIDKKIINISINISKSVWIKSVHKVKMTIQISRNEVVGRLRFLLMFWI